MISPEIVDRVRSANDIVDVIGSYVPLTRSGREFKALSPFQREKTPSFYVNPQKQIFKCFSSGHGGDVFKFLMLFENLTFPEAVRRLAQKAGIEIPQADGKYDPVSRSLIEDLRAVHGALAIWWHTLLKTDPGAAPARDYLRSRNFSMELAEEFGLGFAPDTWDTTQKWALNAGHKMSTLEAGHLVATASNGRKYDFFRGRLMIPIHDEVGQVIAFSGRLLDPNVKAQKYVNSSETPIFTKGKVLFGLNKSKAAIINQGQAIVCEGQIDLMRCWSIGVKNIVAPQGSALTPKQASTIKRLAKQVLLCFDGDLGGRAATDRAVDVLMEEGVTIRVVQLPDGEDPDSFIRKNSPEAFKERLNQAPEFIRSFLDKLCSTEDLTTALGKGNVATKMAAALVRLPNAVQRETLLFEVAARLQVPRSALEDELKKAASAAAKASRYAADRENRIATADGSPSLTAPAMDGPSGQSASVPTAPVPIQQLQVDLLVEELLSILLAEPDQVPDAARKLNPAWFTDFSGGTLLQRLFETHSADAWVDASQFANEGSAPEVNYLSGLLLAPPPTPDFTEVKLPVYVDQLIENMRKRWTRNHLRILEERVKSPTLEPTELFSLFEQIRQLKETL